ncbi:hypothetical protein CVT25_014477 [Psilocybe cyanescens]|uniref:Ricin B lectin domain-containing protein n=1 Tax=Psilocybe cyanescens TaxID=93625 RepID=A0A409XRJ4_PSICY|nr:hypothetical protein CVT25_014477 [Psilocybe cyanescens]
MSLPSGTYRISQWGTFEQPQVLTATEDGVTVLPPGSAPEKDQEWSVESLPDGSVAIQIPARLFPSRSLSYEGEPELGKRIILGPVSDFPTRQWRVEPAPQLPLPVPIRVPDQELVVGIAPIPIYPPRLALEKLTPGLDKAWVFDRVGPE